MATEINQEHFADVDISEELVRESLDKLVLWSRMWVWIVKGAGSVGKNYQVRMVRLLD